MTDENNPATTTPSGEPAGSVEPTEPVAALAAADEEGGEEAPASAPAFDADPMDLTKDLRAWAPWILLVVVPLLSGFIWNFPVGVALFLMILCTAALMQWGRKIRSLGMKWNVGLGLLYFFMLIILPLRLEWCARTWWSEASTNWKRRQNPEKIYGSCNITTAGFTEEQKELLKRWDLCDPTNESQGDVLLAAKLLSIPGDIFTPFEPLDLAPGETFTIIIVETITKWVTVTVEPKKPKASEEDKKDGGAEETPPPPEIKREKVSQLRLTFITPADLTVQDAGKSDAGILTTQSDAGPPVEKVKESVETSEHFNRYTITVPDLSQSTLTIISGGLAAALRGKGERVSREEVNKQVDQVEEAKKKRKK